MTGYVQVYTGDGKGKTTAALGLIVRACGAGLRVYLGQFIKGRKSGEIETLRTRFPDVTVAQYGRGGFIKSTPSPADIRAARTGLAEFRKAMLGGDYDLLIADEIHCAVSAHLLSVEDVLDLIARKPRQVELVLTGRGADDRVIARADLVSDVRAVKHYYDAGVKARKGIDR